jgi:hypothetical protein
MLWYKQDPGGSVVLLIDLYKTEELTKSGKVTAQLGGTRKDSFLSISAAVPGDSGTYFCAGYYRDPQAPEACAQTNSCPQAPEACAQTNSWGSSPHSFSSHSFWHEMW